VRRNLDIVPGVRRFWARRPTKAPRDGPHIGILSPYELRRGLSTLTRNIEWAFDGRAEVFPVRKLGRVDAQFERVRAYRADRELAHPRVVARGTRLVRWLAELDVWIGVERTAPRVCAHCRGAGVRSIIVALPDWLPADPVTRVRELAQADACVVYGAAAARKLEREGLTNVTALPLALAEPLRAARPTGADVVMYFNVGVGGPVDRRQVRLVLEVFRELLPRHPSLHLLVKVHPDAHPTVGAVGSFHPRMRAIEREVSNEQMRALLGEVDVTLFPSRFEGVGYPVLESLHAGVPVIATDAPPMNEIVVHEQNGLLVRAHDAGCYGAQTIRDVEPDDLRSQIERCVTDRALLDRLKSGAHAGRAESAQAFRLAWRELIASSSPAG
jgi:glycosyltransferase involved in cell wall biosynthesis